MSPKKIGTALVFGIQPHLTSIELYYAAGINELFLPDRLKKIQCSSPALSLYLSTHFLCLVTWLKFGINVVLIVGGSFL